jgi:hypothetical protein
MTHFCDLPDDTRMNFRRLIETHGGVADGYQGEHIAALVPNPAGSFYRAMGAGGLELESSFYFPTGSDRYPDSLRHEARYPGSKGFTLNALFRPTA